jgi:hypothetical protein
LASVDIELSIEENQTVASHSSKKIHEMLEKLKKEIFPKKSFLYVAVNTKLCRPKVYLQLIKQLNLLVIY